jgi:hypothetical protein
LTFPSNKGIISGLDGASSWNQMSEDLPQTKYVVEVTVPQKSPQTPKQYVQDLKGVVGGKQLARMKKEAVDCPVLSKAVSFAQCFACPNFIRRVKGKVDCRGFPLPDSA